MKTNLLPTLKKIKKRPPHLDKGICGCARDLMGDPEFNRIIIPLRDLMEKWPETTGDRAFPVEGSASKYLVDSYQDKLWENPRRIALLDWLIKELEK